MLITHLTDFHCLPEGKKLGGRLDANSQARTDVMTATSEEFSPDLLVVTGDLTHSGDHAAMRVARDILDLSPIPYVVIYGGHDDATIFKEIFPEQVGSRYNSNGVLNDIECNGHRIVSIDTLKNSELPSFNEDCCTALDQVLTEKPKIPTTILLHHPPFQCRIAVKAYFEDHNAQWADGLKAVVSRHPQVKLLPCGHVHRTLQRCWGGTLIASAAATCVQVDPDFTAFWETVSHTERNISLIVEPASISFYSYDNDAFTSFVLPAKRDYPRV